MKQAEVLKKQIQYYSYIFGIVVLIMFGRIIGNNGLAYLAIAMETMGIFMVLLGENIADSFAKMIRFRRKREQFLDVISLKKSVLMVQLITGFICFLVVFLLADRIAGVFFQIPNAAFLIRVLSPVLLLRTVVTLLTGYFQSFGAQMPVVAGCILRQILFLVLGKTFCVKLYDYGVKVAGLLQNDDFKGMYGAVGLAIGMLLAESIILVAFLLFYFVSDPNYDKKRCKDASYKAKGMRNNVLNFYQVNSRGMAMAFLKRVLVVLGLFFLVRIEDMGIYYGKYLAICAIPLFMIAARYAFFYSQLVANIRTKNQRLIKETLTCGLQYAWSSGLLATVLLAVLAPQIVNAFLEGEVVLIPLLQHGSLLILGVAMLIYLCMVHFGHNRQKGPLLALTICAIVFVLLAQLMGGKLDNSILAVIYAGEIAICVTAIGFAAVTFRQFRMKPEYLPIFAMPLICVGVAGVIVLLLSKLLSPHIGDGVCFWLGLLIGTILYLVFLGFTRVFGENDVENLYGKYGKLILSVIFK